MLLLRPEKAKWAQFCNGITRQVAGKSVDIEIASRDRGLQRTARWNRLVRLEYDRSRNTLEIVMEGPEKLVVQPQELYAEFGPPGLETIGILDSESAWEIIWLRDLPMLPSPLSISPR